MGILLESMVKATWHGKRVADFTLWIIDPDQAGRDNLIVHGKIFPRLIIPFAFLGRASYAKLLHGALDHDPCAPVPIVRPSIGPS